MIGRAVSKRLVPTNVDMYRMYRNRDVLLQRHRPASYSSSEPHVGLALDIHAGDDQIQRQYLRGSYSVPVHSLRSVPFFDYFCATSHVTKTCHFTVRSTPPCKIRKRRFFYVSTERKFLNKSIKYRQKIFPRSL